MLILLSELALAGACNCGVEYYLARAEGDTTFVSPNPEECHEGEGETGSLMCVLPDPWNPWLAGEAADRQRGIYERIVAIGEKYPEAGAGEALDQGAAWLMLDEDPLRERARALMVAEGMTEKWDLGAAARLQAASLARARCEDRMAFYDAFRRRDPLLQEIGPAPDDVAAERSALACGEDRPWLTWGWHALETEVDPDRLWIYEADELAALRNAVYARHGRPFSSDAMKGWFEERPPLKYLYRRDPAYTDDRLTPLDHRNVTLIKAYEDAKKAGKPHADCVVAARATEAG